MSDVPTYEVILTDAPDIQAKTVIGEGLAAYNMQHTDVDDRRDLAVLLRNTRTCEILGGILGRTSLGLLFIDLVFIQEADAPSWAREQNAQDGRRGRACSRLRQCCPLHHQLPGPGVLCQARMARVRAH